jgi:hypothetical protein
MIGRLIGSLIGRLLLLLCRYDFHKWRDAKLGRTIGGLAGGFGITVQECERCGVCRVLDAHGKQTSVFKD